MLFKFLEGGFEAFLIVLFVSFKREKHTPALANYSSCVCHDTCFLRD